MLHTLQLLDYIASQEDAVLTYQASDMILAAHNDAGYMQATTMNPRQGVELGDISIYPTMQKYHPTMEAFTMLHKLSKL